MYKRVLFVLGDLPLESRLVFEEVQYAGLDLLDLTRVLGDVVL
jgi:hypothetical protein